MNREHRPSLSEPSERSGKGVEPEGARALMDGWSLRSTGDARTEGGGVCADAGHLASEGARPLERCLDSQDEPVLQQKQLDAASTEREGTQRPQQTRNKRPTTFGPWRLNVQHTATERASST